MIKNFEELFLDISKLVFIDVRSPLEFSRGHIPGAYNIPLFSDEVRAIVGKIYVRDGKDPAMHSALKYVGPKLIELVDQAKEIYAASGSKRLCVYCARGGMRSGSVVWLFNMFQLPVVRLSFGYKGYRNWVLEQFNKKRSIKLLGGKTGVGKTEWLQKLKLREQVVDLEALAKHKGSAFGGDKRVQATQQQFENDFAWQWAQLDSSKQVWLEDESRKIGSVMVPECIWKQMKLAPVYIVKVSREDRIKRIMKEYGELDEDFLLIALESIKEHLGYLRYKIVKDFIVSSQIAEAIVVLLEYYDKKYDHGMDDKKVAGMFTFDLSN